MVIFFKLFIDKGSLLKNNTCSLNCRKYIKMNHANIAAFGIISLTLKNKVKVKTTILKLSQVAVSYQTSTMNRCWFTYISSPIYSDEVKQRNKIVCIKCVYDAYT